MSSDRDEPGISLAFMQDDNKTHYPLLVSGTKYYVVGDAGKTFFIRVKAKSQPRKIQKYLLDITVDGKLLDYRALLQRQLTHVDIKGFSNTNYETLKSFKFEEIRPIDGENATGESKNVGKIEIHGYKALPPIMKECVFDDCACKENIDGFSNSVIRPKNNIKDRKFWSRPHLATGAGDVQATKFQCVNCSEVRGDTCLFTRVIQYDTADGLYLRGILQPETNDDHRKLFPENWSPPRLVASKEEKQNERLRSNREMVWKCQECGWMNGPAHEICGVCKEDKPEKPMLMKDIRLQEKRQATIKREREPVRRFETCDLTQSDDEEELWRTRRVRQKRTDPIELDGVVKGCFPGKSSE
eukprot:825165_1